MPNQPTSLHEALSKFQELCPPIGFDNEGQVGTRTYGYATLPAILRKTRPLLRELGLVVTQTVQGRSIHTKITHLPTQEISLSIIDLTDVADMQKLGSAVTYGRRYAYCTDLGIAPDEDDDGAATVGADEPSEAVQVRKASAAANRERTAPAAFVTPEGWDNEEQSLEMHNDLAARIGALSDEVKAQCRAFRQTHGWPMARSKFDELETIVVLAEHLTDGS